MEDQELNKPKYGRIVINITLMLAVAGSVFYYGLKYTTNYLPAEQSADSTTIAQVKNEQILLSSNQKMALAPSINTFLATPVYPSPKHIFIVMLENKTRQQVEAGAPYLVSLGNSGAKFTNYFALQNPSQPNYIGIFAGTRCGVADNTQYPASSFTQLNISTTIGTKGKTFATYAEDLPSIGSTVWTSGLYAGRHDPARNFANVNQNTRKPLSQLPSNLDLTATVNFIIPNNAHNGHDTNLKTCDDYMKLDPKIQAMKTYCDNPANQSLFITLFDEGVTGNNNVYVSFNGFQVKKGAIITKSLGHYDLTNLICDMYGAPRVNTASTLTTTMDGWFTTSVVVPPSDTCTVAATKDTTVTVIVPQTVYNVKDSTYVVNYRKPCTILPPSDTIWRAIYINSVNSIVGVPVREQACIDYCKLKKFTSAHYYSVALADKVKLAKFNVRMHTEAGITEITPTGGSSSTFTGSYTAFNQANVPLARFDAWNLEFESWNAANIYVASAENKAILQQMKAGMTAGKVTQMTDYFGWMTKAPLTTEAPAFLVDNCTYGLFHDYRPAPDWSYLQGRFDQMEVAAKQKGKIFSIAVIFSAEPDFMQAWLKTHTLDEAFAIIAQGFRARNYKNVKLKGYIVFHLDFLRVSQPDALPPSMMARQARSGVPYFAAPDFVNVTDPKHIEMAKVPE